MHSVNDVVVCWCDFNLHADTNIYEIYGVHGRCHVCQWNSDEIILVEYVIEKELLSVKYMITAR